MSSLSKIRKAFFLVIIAFPLFASTAVAANKFYTGWWEHQSGGTSLLSDYNAKGQSMFILDGGYCGLSQLTQFKSYLDVANQYGMKVFVNVTCGPDNVPSISTADFITTVNALKSYPALYGWLVGDEPEATGDPTISQRRHDELFPYYNLLKQYDPAHPAMISHDMNSIYQTRDWPVLFFDVEDIIGMHAYPYYTTTPINGASNIYDKWVKFKQMIDSYNLAHGTNKTFFAATGQAFGPDFGVRFPTYDELRFESFSAILIGVPSVLYWEDEFARQDGMEPIVARIMTDIQGIGGPMNNSIISDPRIGVSITDRNVLGYRYGVDGTTHGILAINIANRSSSAGQLLSNVKFTLPSTVHPSTVSVVSENRTITVAADNSFSDMFQPFAVHEYIFNADTSAKPGDVNGDGAVNILDIGILIDNYGLSPIPNPAADVNHDGSVNILDIGIIIDNYGK